MRLEKVTITGADDSTDIKQLLDLSGEFPFVEWGILVSRKQEGGYRFPSSKWISELSSWRVGHIRADLNLSMHLCGEWVRQLLVGQLDWALLPDIATVAQRVQINTHGEPHVSTTAMIASLMYGASIGVRETRDSAKFREYIFQYDGVNNHLAHAAKAYETGYRVSALYDTSSGAGRLPKRWEAPGPEFNYGYAGGLSPDNVVEQIEEIEDRAFKALIPEYKPYWIDMERRVRTDDDSQLDMKKVRRVLELCAPFVKAPVAA
jgi:hypothetical protein